MILSWFAGCCSRSRSRSCRWAAALLLERAACHPSALGGLLPAAGFAVVLVAGHIATAGTRPPSSRCPPCWRLQPRAWRCPAAARSRRRTGGRSRRAAPCTASFAAPIVLSGDATFAGYIKLDDTATWLAMTDRLMEHGRNLSGLADSSVRGDPRRQPEHRISGRRIPAARHRRKARRAGPGVGVPALPGAAGRLHGDSRSTCSPAGRSTRAPARALAAAVASQSALLFAYSLWGGVKELAAAWASRCWQRCVVPLLSAARQRLLGAARSPSQARRCSPC